MICNSIVKNHEFLKKSKPKYLCFADPIFHPGPSKYAEQFRKDVKVVQANNRIFADNLDYFNLKRLIKVYGNVRGKSLDGNFTSDVLNLNIDNQSVDVFMVNNEQVKINLKK